MLNATSPTSVTSWQWTVDNPSSGSWNIYSPSSPSTYVSVSGGGGISVTATNACGSTKTGVTIYSNCGSPLIASPNPAGDEVTVAVTDDTQTVNATNKLKTTLYQIKVSDVSGNVRKHSSYPAGISSVRISLADLPQGVYTIQGFDGKVWSSIQIIKR